MIAVINCANRANYDYGEYKKYGAEIEVGDFKHYPLLGRELIELSRIRISKKIISNSRKICHSQFYLLLGYSGTLKTLHLSSWFLTRILQIDYLFLINSQLLKQYL